MIDTRPRIVQVETHVTHTCNMTCESCSHFSNEGYSGRETPESFRAAVSPWAKKLLPGAFLVLGGEPTLNPDLCEILEIARELWPEQSVRIMLVTNGWFLHRHPRLAQVVPANRIRLDISLHHDAPEYLKKVQEIKELVESWGIRPYFRMSHRDWTRIYRGAGKDARPYADRNPQKSWQNCVSKWCMNIHEGKLWKCPVVAYLPMHVAKYGDAEGRWAPYLQYTPLEPTCSEHELRQFIVRRCETVCNMCPADPQRLIKELPVRIRE